MGITRLGTRLCPSALTNVQVRSTSLEMVALLVDMANLGTVKAGPAITNAHQVTNITHRRLGVSDVEVKSNLMGICACVKFIRD